MRISVPVAPTPVVSEAEGRPSSITREILESYLVCKTKTFLKLKGERGLKSDLRGPFHRDQGQSADPSG